MSFSLVSAQRPQATRGIGSNRSCIHLPLHRRLRSTWASASTITRVFLSLFNASSLQATNRIGSNCIKPRHSVRRAIIFSTTKGMKYERESKTKRVYGWLNPPIKGCGALLRVWEISLADSLRCSSPALFVDQVREWLGFFRQLCSLRATFTKLVRPVSRLGRTRVMNYRLLLFLSSFSYSYWVGANVFS